MEFCPKCETRLVTKRKKDGKGCYLTCLKCGYKKTVEPEACTLKVTAPKPQDQLVVIGKKEQKLKTLPTVSMECPKCGNNTAYSWQVQTRGADESSTQFFRCTKCNYTFREYS
ncbi:MAG: transcription factor S [Candidatus Bathyarchaeia archaeon]|nr:transcription factor S [Candidatus Bathyarchaeota archaeon]